MPGPGQGLQLAGMEGLPGVAPEAQGGGMPSPMPGSPAPAQKPQSAEVTKLNKYIEETNLADDLDEQKLIDIAEEVYEGYVTDCKSRAHWEDNLEEWTKLALQTREVKSHPWPNASNIKFPLLAIAAMQFSARAYPTLIPSDGKIVHAEVIGTDADGKKAERAERVSDFMSYQLMKQMEDWDEQMDKLLLILPIVGTCFKKTYYDSVKKKNCSKLVLPKDLVVNYWAQSLDGAERKTERIEMSRRVLKERQMAGIFLDIDLAKPSQPLVSTKDKTSTTGTQPPEVDKTTPYILLEQHTYLELDDDGYPEPYIVTIEEQSKKVLRIVARFDSEGIISNDKGDLVKIEAVEYYTKYGFIPNPDGGFYDIGFGLLLGPINASVNTIINQLVDRGTLDNLGGGFIGKGLRIALGDRPLKPGQWVGVNATGDDIKKQIFPMQGINNSSGEVLFKLLAMLIQSAKELASVAEIFVGKMPGQNTPATTTMATIEQGMKVFTAVYKRVYRSLTKELKKLYRLNRMYLDPQEEVLILDGPIGQGDFEEKSYDVCPAADPQATSTQEKIAKASSLGELLPMGTLDPMAVTMRILTAQEQPRIQELIRKGPPPADPKQQEMQQKAQLEQQKASMQQAATQQKMQMEQQKAELDAQGKKMELAMKQQMQAQEMQHKEAMAVLEMKIEQVTAQIHIATEKAKATQEVQASHQDHNQKMQQSQEAHSQKMKQARQMPKATKGKK